MPSLKNHIKPNEMSNQQKTKNIEWGRDTYYSVSVVDVGLKLDVAVKVEESNSVS